MDGVRGDVLGPPHGTTPAVSNMLLLTKCYECYEELTKCYEPLQNLRVRLWPWKIDLNPPVTLCYCSFQVGTSVVVLFVLCLGVYNIFVLLAPYVCFHIFS